MGADDRIKFVCSCGKRLRARGALAARRTRCPRCGQPVGIPSLAAPVPNAPAGPMTPAERFRTRRCVPPTSPVPADLLAPEAVTAPPDQTVPATPGTTATSTAPETPQRVPRRRQAETRWFHCLLYPFRAWPVVLGLAIILTLLTGVAALALPVILEGQSRPRLHLAVCALFVMIPLTAVGYACASLECVLRDAAAGRVPYVAWPGGDLGQVMASSVRWLTCFLAGPVAFAAAAVLFWVNCGEPQMVDRLILVELVTLAVGYWLFALLSVTQRGLWPGLNPAQVGEWVHRLGYRAAIAAAIAATILLVHGQTALAAVEEVHNGTGRGWLWLTACWFSTLFWASFLFRLLGVWCYRARHPEATAHAPRHP